MPALLRIRFALSKEVDGITPSEVHGLFFRLLPKDVVEKIHDLKKKPFSLWILLAQGRSLELRVGVLDDEFLPTIFYGYYTTDEELYLKDAKVFPIKPNGIKQEKVKSYEELLQTKARKSLCFEFLKPTCFNRYGLDYPLPDAVFVFKNLLLRWKAYAKEPLWDEENFEEALLRNVAIKELEITLSTSRIAEDLFLKGFSGKVCYAIKDQELAKVLWTLARFAEFSGVGRKTTMDMGMVKVI